MRCLNQLTIRIILERGRFAVMIPFDDLISDIPTELVLRENSVDRIRMSNLFDIALGVVLKRSCAGALLSIDIAKSVRCDASP